MGNKTPPPADPDPEEMALTREMEVQERLALETTPLAERLETRVKVDESPREQAPLGLQQYETLVFDLDPIEGPDAAVDQFAVSIHQKRHVLALTNHDTPTIELVEDGKTTIIESEDPHGRVVDLAANANGIFWLTSTGRIMFQGVFSDEDTTILHNPSQPREIPMPPGTSPVVAFRLVFTGGMDLKS